jgi:pimeloyl-ACP methyl ester carboxylesterase
LCAVESNEYYINVQADKIYLKYFRPEYGALQPSDIKNVSIVLLHESLGSVAVWKQFPQLLANHTGCQVIAYDRLGFGLSSARTDMLTDDFVWTEAKDTFAAVIEACQLDKFIVLGHSVGGGMALSVAVAYPQQCLAVISLSAQAKVEQLTLDGIQAAQENFKDHKLFQRLAKYHGVKTQWVLDAWTKTWLAPAFLAWDLAHILEQVQCPVLVIHGAQDEYATCAQPEQIAAQVKGEVQLCILEGCGHFPHQEKTAEVLQHVHVFIESLDEAKY